MKLYVTVEEFLYAKKIENQTERTLRGYKNALNLFANWLQKEWTIDELEKIRVIHLKQYVAYHLKMGHKATYVNGIIKILRAFFKYTNGEDYTDIAYEKVAWVREEKPVIKAFSAQDARQLLEYYDNKSYLCLDLKKLGAGLRTIAMLIMQDLVNSQVSMNFLRGIATWCYFDEFHVLLRDRLTASYCVAIWKMLRKKGCVPSALTQNVKDFLASPEIENIFENSDFLVLLSQAQGDRQILAKQLGISPHQLSYVTHTNSGEGLLFFGNTTIPFVDRFPQNTELYAIMTTRPEDKKQEMNRA